VGIYVSVRGWLQCDEKQLAAIKAITDPHDDDFYAGGWSLPRRHFNWTHYVFYGGDIRDQSVGPFLGQLREIACVPPSDADNDRVRGLFLASHETCGMTEWQVRDGQVLATPADRRYRYLDA
jgi:hypothetical protein